MSQADLTRGMDSSIGLLDRLKANLGRLLVAVYVALFSWAAVNTPSQQRGACLVAVVLVGVVAWLTALRRARAIVQLAPSRIGSAAQGYVQLEGRVGREPSDMIQSPLGRVRCVWYRYHLYSKDNSRGEWREVDSGVSSATFEIRDGTGACRVDPDNAEVSGAVVRTSHPGDGKLVEELLFADKDVFVQGEFRTLNGPSAALDRRQDLNVLLSEWKADRSHLMRRFDLDRDGELDQREWELARKLATETVESQHREIHRQPGIDIVSAPRDGRPFLISTKSPKKLRMNFLYWSFFHLTVAVLAAAYLER